MYQAYKLLDIVKEYLCLESEQELADFFDINLNELELIRNGEQEISIEKKLIILNYFIRYDENGVSLCEKLDSGYLFHSLCRTYSLNTWDFLKKGDKASNAYFIKALRKVITIDYVNFNKETELENIGEFLGIKQSDIQDIEKGTKRLSSISKLRILSWIEGQEFQKKNSNPFNQKLSPFHKCGFEEFVYSDSSLFDLLIDECLAQDPEILKIINQINDSVIIKAFSECMGIEKESEVALLLGSTSERIGQVTRDEEKLNLDEVIALILLVIGKNDLRQCITGGYLKNRILGMRRKWDEKLSIIDCLKKHKKLSDNKIIANFQLKKEELLALRENKMSLDDLPALSRLKIFTRIENIPIKEIDLAIQSKSYLLKLIDLHRLEKLGDANEKPDCKENNPVSYKPEGLNRLLWLAAKNIAIPDPEFGYKDLVLFAMSLHSGCKLGDIRVNDMVDTAICALGEYYRHAGINEINLGNLLKPFRTEYALMVNEKFNQDDGSRKIIEACMTQLMLAPMRSEDKQFVDLGKPDVSYEEVWARAVQEQNEYHEQRVAGIHKKCREDGEAKCLRWYESVWLEQVTGEEKMNMVANECMCEKAQNRKIEMLCDFKIDESGKDVWLEH